MIATAYSSNSSTTFDLVVDSLWTMRFRHGRSIYDPTPRCDAKCMDGYACEQRVANRGARCWRHRAREDGET